jgi:hypothetical protein
MSYTPRINDQTWQKLYKYFCDFEGIYPFGASIWLQILARKDFSKIR